MKQKRQNWFIFKNMLHLYIGFLRKQRYICKVIMLMYFTISVASQPLNLPPERFKCGPDSLNLSCARWGFDACITDGGESYCFPCKDEHLTTLCGTQEEIQGCNLYCTQVAIENEIQRTRENYSEQLEHISQQKELAKEEKLQLLIGMKSMERLLRNKTTAVIAISVALGISVVIFIIFVIYLIRLKLNNKKERFDDENPYQDDRDVSDLLIKDDNSDSETNISDETVPKEPNIKPDSIENLNVSDNSLQDTISTEDESVGVIQCQDTECKAIQKLNSIPATNTEGSNRFAINKIDASHPQDSS